MKTSGCQLDENFEAQCPSCKLLEQFANLALPTAINHALRLHVLRCPTCQSKLDALTDEPRSDGWSRAAPAAVPAPSLDAGSTISGSTISGDYGSTVERIVDRLCDEVSISHGRSLDSGHAIELAPSTVSGNIGQLGRYLVRRELASGATATVFEAIDSTNDQPVALKLIRAGDAQTVKRVEREARALQSLEHPNIVTLKSIERAESGRLFLVMPLVPGQSLSELINNSQLPTIGKIVDIVVQIADGLTEVHSRSLLHRDIKPGNILVDQDGHARLTDFGLAAFLDEESSLTESGVIVGTPCYMSPEQVRGSRTIDARSDIYSLGITLYECLTETRPFRGTTAQVIEKILRDEPLAPRSINSQIPQELENICLRAMAKEPERRFNTAQEFSDDLKRFLQNIPIATRAPSHLARAQVWLHRHPSQAAWLATILLGITSASVFVVWQWQQAIHQRDAARQNMRTAVRAVDKFYNKLNESDDAERPGLQPLKRELMQLAIKSYEEFLAEWPDDPVLTSDYALALGSLANTTDAIGTLEEKLQSWQRAKSAFQAQLFTQPQDRRWQEKIYQADFHIANALMNANKLPEAVTAFQNVQTTVKQLLVTTPNRHEYRRDLAACLGSLGNCEMRCSHFAEAKDYYRLAASEFRQLRALEPQNTDLSFKLAVTLTNMAMCSSSAEEQLPLYQEARTTLLALGDSTTIPMLARRLAKIDWTEGAVAQELNNHEHAMECWRDGIARMEPLVQQNPAVQDYRWLLAQLQASLGAHATSNEEALKFLNMAVENQTLLNQADPANRGYTDDLARTQAELERRAADQ